MAASYPGGRQEMRSATVENLPHVTEKFSGMVWELMDRDRKVVDRESGNEKFCTSLYFPHLPTFDMMEMGDVWMGLIS